MNINEHLKGQKRMNGIIKRRNKLVLWMWLLIICGLFLSGLFICIMLSEEVSNADDYFVSIFFIAFGAFCLCIGLIGLINEYRTFISASENGIEAFSAYPFMGRRVTFRYSDIMSVDFGTAGGLRIRLHDQANDFEIANLQNREELIGYIRKRIRYRKPKADAETLRESFFYCQASRRSTGRKLICLFACLIILIAAAIIFTGAKEIHEFNRHELIVFILIAVLFVIMLAAICACLPRMLKLNAALDHTADQLAQLLLRNAVPGPGSIITMFLDDKDHADFRCVVYRYPQSESVFYTIEALNSDFEMEVIEVSDVYPDLESLPEKIRTMAEIPVPKGKQAF